MKIRWFGGMAKFSDGRIDEMETLKLPRDGKSIDIMDSEAFVRYTTLR